MSPLAFVQAATAAALSGELSTIYGYAMGYRAYLVLATNAAIAFGLNAISFTANKQVGALTMTVAANFKQVLAVVLAVVCWDLRVGWMNASGK